MMIASLPGFPRLRLRNERALRRACEVKPNPVGEIAGRDVGTGGESAGGMLRDGGVGRDGGFDRGSDLPNDASHPHAAVQTHILELHVSQPAFASKQNLPVSPVSWSRFRQGTEG